MGFPSSMRGSPLNSIFEANGGPGGNVEASHMETTTNLGDTSILSAPEQALVIPPEVSNAESVSEAI